jgi:hypothetical protein
MSRVSVVNETQLRYWLLLIFYTFQKQPKRSLLPYLQIYQYLIVLHYMFCSAYQIPPRSDDRGCAHCDIIVVFCLLIVIMLNRIQVPISADLRTVYGGEYMLGRANTFIAKSMIYNAATSWLVGFGLWIMHVFIMMLLYRVMVCVTAATVLVICVFSLIYIQRSRRTGVFIRLGAVVVAHLRSNVLRTSISTECLFQFQLWQELAIASTCTWNIRFWF